MATNPPIDSSGAARRVVLIDFDWQDADLMPQLLRQSGIRVQLVAGAREDEAGVRVAELCGVPRSTELADLTREIFDLALVSERSVRRSQIERLLLALGTPVASPQSFLDRTPAAAPNGHVNGQNAVHLSNLLAEALPDLSQPPPAAASESNGSGKPHTDPMPAPDDRPALERTLERWRRESQARGAELYLGTNGPIERHCRVGAEDALLGTLARLALDDDAAHVVSRLDGPDRGKAWGAWPFRTRSRRGVLAAAVVDAVDGRAMWERMAQELRVAWEGLEHARSGVADPLLRRGWLGLEEFRARLEPTVERNRVEGARSTLHRLSFGGPVECVEAVCRELPHHLRENDEICHPAPRDVLLLTSGSPAAFAQIRRRLTMLWEEVWRSAGQRAPAPPISDEHIELLGPEDADNFRAVARDWLAGE